MRGWPPCPGNPLDESQKTPRALFIHNARSGRRLFRRACTIRVRDYLVRCGFQVELVQVDDGFERRMADVEWSGMKLVVAAGGDGTVRLAAGAVHASGEKIPLLIIPRGSANVAASALGIPFALRGALKLLERGTPSAVDLGMLNGRTYFIVGFSAGYISEVVTSTSRSAKGAAGFLAYLLQMLWARPPRTQEEFLVQHAGHEERVRGNSLVVFNAINLYGISPRRSISLSDGVLNLYVVSNRNLIQLIRVGLDFLRYEKPPRQVFSLEATHFQVVLPRKDMVTQVDGDRIAEEQAFSIQVLPDAIEVLTPARRKATPRNPAKGTGDDGQWPPTPPLPRKTP